MLRENAPIFVAILSANSKSLFAYLIKNDSSRALGTGRSELYRMLETTMVGFMRSISRIECVMTCVRNMLNFVPYLIILEPHLFWITKYDE